jgi:repressor LexA
MLTRKQHELICFINDRLDETGVSPSFEEMKEALDLKSKSGVHRLISALEERQFIRRLPNRARALEVLKMPERGTNTPTKTTAAPAANLRAMPEPANDVIEIPLHGRIAAGVPIEAFEGASMLAVPAALLGNGEHYALEVAVALIEESEATLKFFRREGAMIRLDPANRAYDPQRYAPAQVRVQGKLAGILRRYD